MQEKKPASWPAESMVFRFSEEMMRHNPNGSESRTLGLGGIATGERVRVHESVQPAGIDPVPPHTIGHTELMCVREGALEFLHNGKTDRAEAGDMILIAMGTLHRVRNVGTGPASYFVVSVGGDV